MGIILLLRVVMVMVVGIVLSGDDGVDASAAGVGSGSGGSYLTGGKWRRRRRFA